MIKIEGGKQVNKKKIVLIIIIILFIIAIVSLIALYISKKEVRDWVDIYILKKNITEEDISEIDLNTDKVTQVYAYSKYIAVLNEKNIILYNSYGEELTKIEVNINTALFDANGKYFAIAEESGNEICLILDKTYLWSATIEGQILQIHVNQNGYVVVVTTDSIHKSIVNLYNPSGKQLFKSYFSSTRVVDASISKDNKYIAIGELDISGTLIQSNIKIISIENAQSDSDNAIIYTYNSDNNNLITSVKYQNQGQILCMYDDRISMIEDEQNTDLLKIEDNNNITFMSVNFDNNIVYLEENDAGLFKSSTNIKVVNTATSQETSYVLDDIAKEIYVQDNVVCINVGTELYLFDTNGWLIKKYTGSQEITNVVLSENLAGIIYKDRIIIIKL